MIEKKTDLVALGVDRLVNDFKIKKNISGILATWLEQAKRLDDLAVDVLYAHLLRSAIGVQLDRAGALLGEQRNGASDADYRATILLSARARASTGRVLDTFEIMALLLGAQDFDYAESWPGGYTLVVYSFPSAVLFASLLRLLGYAKPAGFKGVLSMSPRPASQVMRWGSASSPSAGRGPASAAFPLAVTSVFAHAAEIKSP